jgi:hypothetical protein
VAAVLGLAGVVAGRYRLLARRGRHQAPRLTFDVAFSLFELVEATTSALYVLSRGELAAAREQLEGALRLNERAHGLDHPRALTP